MLKPRLNMPALYYPQGLSSGQPLAAIVAHAFPEGNYVNLAIFNTNGQLLFNPPARILVVQDGDERPKEGRYCVLDVPPPGGVPAVVPEGPKKGKGEKALSKAE